MRLTYDMDISPRTLIMVRTCNLTFTIDRSYRITPDQDLDAIDAQLKERVKAEMLQYLKDEGYLE